MKAGNSILDADMATIGNWLRTGLAWWGEELRALLPAGLRRAAKPLDAYIAYRGAGRWERVGGAAAATVLVDPGLCLVRTLKLPPLGDADLRRLVALDADRIFPIPAAQLVIGVCPSGADRSQVSVAAMPRADAEAMVAALAGAGLKPERYAIADPAETAPAMIDLTRGLVEAGLVAPAPRTALGWWMVVAFLFALNIALLVWRDVQDVQRLEALVADQGPAVGAARAISNRISQTQRQAQQLAARRGSQDAVAVLGAVTAALPERAWVQRYAWDGRTIRLTGYKRENADVVGALRNAGFEGVRAAASETIAEVPAGRPFDVTASVGRVGR